MTSENTNTNPTAAEALATRVPFLWRETAFTVEPTSEWSYDALENYEDGRITHFLRSVLGAEEHKRFKTLKPKAADVEDFVGAIQKALGISGN